MKHIPRKRFGQNFLTDQSVLLDIIRVIDPKPDDTIVEIGPGRVCYWRKQINCTWLNLIAIWSSA